MKTRKVGRVLSLLLAIAMVVGLMIPASSVLAAESYTPVSSHAALKKALDEASTDPNVTTRIMLAENITVPAPYFTESGYSDFNQKKGYVATTVSMNREHNNNAALQTFTGYNDVVLTIHENTNVVIDLNGKSISMVDTYQARGKNNDPNPDPKNGGSGGMASVLTVKGNLTVKDSSGNNSGKITGGTGNIIEANDIAMTSTGEYTFYVGPAGTIYGTPLPGTRNERTVSNLDIYQIDGNISKACGGGVFVDTGATFTLEGGSITENTAWVAKGSTANRKYLFGTNGAPETYGGGVYVSEGATFNMYGGIIEMNTTRGYSRDSNGAGAFSRGAGVYLAPSNGGVKGAVMNFTAGNIDNNCTYLNIKTNATPIEAFSEGGGVFVGNGAVLNMFGNEHETDRAKWPSVSDNSCGGYFYQNKASNDAFGYLYLQGAGIEVQGTVNMARAVITANTFAKMDLKDSDPETDDIYVTVVDRDLATNRVLYTDENGNTKNEDGELYLEGDTYVASDGTEKTVTLKTIKTHTSESWTYGVGIYHYSAGVKSNVYAYTNGAGINLSYADAEDGSGDFYGALNIGDRVWCYDNWDLNTSPYKTVLVVGNKTQETTQDDIYLAESKNRSGEYQYIGCAAPATESKIGVNDQNTGATRIIVKKSNPNTIDADVWGKYADYNPTLTDVQFFWDNGANDRFREPNRVVIYDDSNINAPILRFGEQSLAYNSDDDAYKTYVMLNFNEADVHKYAQFTGSGTSMKGTWDDTYKTTEAEQWLTKNDKPFGVELPRPNYSLYNGASWTSLETYTDKVDNNTVTHRVDEAGAKNSIATRNGTERADLYFKGYQFYSPYGHFEGLLNYVGKTTENNRNDVELPGLLTHEFTGNNLLTWNDNKLHISVPAYTAMWYTADELADARTRVSNVKAQAVVLANGSEAIRFIALVDSRYAEYDEAGFVFSLNNATPTVEGGYDFSSKSKIYKKVMTKTSANPDGEWIDVYYMMHPDKTPAGTMKVDWTEFSDAKGILYTNIIVNDASISTVYYATPYVRTGTTYYYGESRAISYDWLTQQDAASANS